MRQNYFYSPMGATTKTLDKVKYFSSFLIVCLTLLTGKLSAQIATYSNATSGSLSSVAANATGTPLARANGITAPGSPCSTGFSATTFSSTSSYNDALGAVEVTITPDAGHQLNVTGFSAGLRRSNTGPASVRFAYSTDLINWVDQGTDQAPRNASCGSTTTASWTTSFSTTDPLKFRIYGFNASQAGGTLQILNLNINGTVSSSVVAAPAVTTNPATAITSTSATLHALVNPNSASTTVDFLYGTTTGTYTSTIAAAQSPVITTTNTTAAPSLNVNTQYFYIASATNSAGTTNGAEESFWTLANVPSAPVVNNATLNSLDVTLQVNGNPAATEFALYETSTGEYVQASGILGALPVWQDATTWGTVTVSGLSMATTYTFEAKARNGALEETAFSTAASNTTLSNCASPSNILTSNISCSTAELNWTAATGSIEGYEYAVVTSATPPASGTFVSSTSALLSGLAPNTTYNVFVRTQCDPSSFSLWIGPVSFSTGAGSFYGSLLLYDPTGSTHFGISPLPPTTVADDVIAGDLLRGAGVSTVNTAALNAWGGHNWQGNVDQDVRFTIEAAPNVFMGLDTLKLRYRRSNTGPATGTLQYSYEGGPFTVISTLSFSSTSSSGAYLAVPLTSISEFQGIQNGSVVEFRILPTGGAGGGTWYVYSTGSEPGLRIIGSVSPFTASISGSATICESGNTDITITGYPEDAYVTYTINGDTSYTTLVDGEAVINTGALSENTVFELISIDFSSSSSCGQAVSGTATVTVIAAPEITVQPANDNVCEGSLLSLSVTALNATGYQWLLNGLEIPGAISDVYEVLNATSADEGNYQVIVFGAPCAPDTSVVAEVIVEDCGARKGNLSNSSFENAHNALLVYPNPSEGALDIELPFGNGIDAIELYNLQGVKIAEEQAAGVSFLRSNIFEKCANGSYLLKVRAGEQTFQKLVIKGK